MSAKLPAALEAVPRRILFYIGKVIAAPAPLGVVLLLFYCGLTSEQDPQRVLFFMVRKVFPAALGSNLSRRLSAAFFMSKESKDNSLFYVSENSENCPRFIALSLLPVLVPGSCFPQNE